MLQWILEYGGPVMPALLALSVLTIAAFVERFFVLHTAQAKDLFFLDGIRNLLRNGSRTEALAQCDDIPAPFQALIRAGILNMDGGRRRVENAVVEAGTLHIRRLERNLTLFATLAVVIPMLGFLGTVLGLIESLQQFEAASQAATRPVSPAAYSAGLWHALLSSAVAIGLGILAYMGYHYLVSRAQTIVYDMEAAASELLALLDELVSESEPLNPLVTAYEKAPVQQ